MDEKLDVADLVVHLSRRDSHGVITRLEGDLCWVQWCTPIGGKAIGPEELCERAMLEATTCPACGEPQCWCGVGR